MLVSRIKKLAKGRYSPDQARDDGGKWTDGGGPSQSTRKGNRPKVDQWQIDRHEKTKHLITNPPKVTIKAGLKTRADYEKEFDRLETQRRHEEIAWQNARSVGAVTKTEYNKSMKDIHTKYHLPMFKILSDRLEAKE